MREGIKRYTKGQVQWLMPINLDTQEVEIRRITVQGQPRQKVHKIPPQQKTLDMVVHSCHSNIGSIIRRTVVQAGLCKKQDSFSKRTITKRVEAWLKL
jgi:hypothetical protein